MKYAILALALLAGCASPEQRAERDIANHGPYCDRMGYQQGSDAWRDCVTKRGTEMRAASAAAGRER